jgi:translation initiation factor IF-2
MWRRRQLQSDVTLAEGFNAAIMASGARNKEAAAAAKRNGIEIRYYNIIYGRRRHQRRCRPARADTARNHAGNAQIRKCSAFQVGKVAGCRISDSTTGTRRQYAPDPRQRRRAGSFRR